MNRDRMKFFASAGLLVPLLTALAGCSKDSVTQALGTGSPETTTVTLPEGTVLKVRLTPTLSTESHSVGDRFEATLVEPLVVDGRTVAPLGGKVYGQVVEADKGGRVKGRARIGVQLTSLETPTGVAVDIATNSVAREARATKGEDAKKIGIGTGVGAGIGAVAGGGRGAAIGAAAGAGAGTGAVLATRGESAVLPSETVLNFRLRYPVEVR